jgi:hypothetical protein
MTFAQNTGIRSRSPSFTPDRQKQVQSRRNEDSAPQHLEGRLALQTGSGEPIAAGTGARVTVSSGPFRGACGRVTGSHDRYRLTVLFDDWHKVGDSRHLLAPVFASDLGSYVVPPKHRPVAVGRLR